MGLPGTARLPAGAELRTGLAGSATAALGVLYAALYVVYLAGYVTVPYAAAISLRTFVGVFFALSLFKPLLLLGLVLASLANVTGVGPALVLTLFVGAFLVGSLGFLVVLMVDLVGCNTSLAPLSLCTDPLYCCVYYTRSECAGLGPCMPGPSVPQTAAELMRNPDFVGLLLFGAAFFVLELVLLWLAWKERSARLRDALKLKALAQREGILDEGYGEEEAIESGFRGNEFGDAVKQYRVVGARAAATQLATRVLAPTKHFSWKSVWQALVAALEHPIENELLPLQLAHRGRGETAAHAGRWLRARRTGLVHANERPQPILVAGPHRYEPSFSPVRCEKRPRDSPSYDFREIAKRD